MFRREVSTILFFLCCALTSTWGQKVITLANPSFEGLPHSGGNAAAAQSLNYINEVNPFNPIKGWTDCGWKNETPPDLHGANTEFFGVSRKPQHGVSFLGMVVRSNDSWERLSQELTQPLEAGKCYKISVYLARDLNYRSHVHNDPAQGQIMNTVSETEQSFAQPCVLRIHGGVALCSKQELLTESIPIKNTEWEKYEFTFRPTKSYKYIEFEAFYKTPVLFPYNGNILLDNASNIEEIDCPDNPGAPGKPVPETPVLAAQVPETTPQSPQTPIRQPKTTTTPSVKEDVTVGKPKEKILKDLDGREVTKGQVIQLEQLYFEADESKITAGSYDVLDEVYDFLKENPKVAVEIGGHTNDKPPHHYCDSLSTARAESVTRYLVRRGIDKTRIQSKGYGKRNPIATNKTSSGRKRNQRVEIKILSLDGTTG